MCACFFYGFFSSSSSSNYCNLYFVCVNYKLKKKLLCLMKHKNSYFLWSFRTFCMTFVFILIKKINEFPSQFFFLAVKSIFNAKKLDSLRNIKIEILLKLNTCMFLCWIIFFLDILKYFSAYIWFGFLICHFVYMTLLIHPNVSFI